MAKRSRKRRRRSPPPPPAASRPEAARSAPAARAAVPRRRRPGERPQAPWGSFPLVEIAVLVALAMLVAGFVVGGGRGAALVVAGLAVGSVAGLELAISEHFAGYRSHTLMLSGAAGLATLVFLHFATPSLKLWLAMLVAVGVFLACAWLLVRAFRRRSGVSFRFR